MPGTTDDIIAPVISFFAYACVREQIHNYQTVFVAGFFQVGREAPACGEARFFIKAEFYICIAYVSYQKHWNPPLQRPVFFCLSLL